MKPSLPLSAFLSDVSTLVCGCMGLGGKQYGENAGLTHAMEAVDTAREQGINLFDHADIYAGGNAERMFAKVLNSRPGMREQIYIQSKCGIRLADELGPKRYDWSADWIQSSVEGSLTRLGTDYLDVLFLHRPDPLANMEEVAGVIDSLQRAGKIRFLAVSNMHCQQIALLQSCLKSAIVANQVEISLKSLHWLEEGVVVGNSHYPAVNFAPGTLEYCQQQGVQLQAWGCLGQGIFSGKSTDDEPEFIRNTAAMVSQLSLSFGVSREAIVLAWLTRHPANIQPVIGTTNPQRIRNCAEYEGVNMSREQWYALYEAARGQCLP